MAKTLMGYEPPDPHRQNIFLDSCAFDPKYIPEDQAAKEIFERHENGQLLGLKIAHSTLKEIEYPNTPDWVKRAAAGLLYSIDVSLTPEEQADRDRILDVLAGNGSRDRMGQDATHVFEASKYTGYFVTTDERILKKKNELENICAATIVKPSEFLSLVQKYETSGA
ncbi:hypothetical protein PO002_37645 [Cupriavidus necator]|uniref:hypothetical protein n=1 Tax=Cupriavidus necator TaxID=106590 RepID=UPI0039C03ED6